jgi:4-amino-4-deoxy-L-arabinose transferase-like glycosyltransferase
VAGAVSSGHGYALLSLTGPAVPTAHKPPLYPLLVALLSTLGLKGRLEHQLASVVLGTGTVVVAALLARRLAGPRAGVLAAALAAVYPIFLITDASLRSETLFALLVGLVLLAAFRAAERPTATRFGLLGALVGLTALTRSEGLVLLVLPALAVAWRTGRRRRGRLAAATTVACVVVLAPWLIRCWIVFDRPVLISTNSGDLVAGANCPPAYEGPLIGTWQPRCAVGRFGANEAVASERRFRRGLRYARDHAGRLPAVLAARALRTWSLFRPEQQLRIDLTEGRNRTAGEAGRAACYVLVLLALAGALALRRRGRSLLIIASPFALIVFVSLTAYGVTRFRIAGDLGLVVLAGVALDALGRRRGRAARPATGVE